MWRARFRLGLFGLVAFSTTFGPVGGPTILGPSADRAYAYDQRRAITFNDVSAARFLLQPDFGNARTLRELYDLIDRGRIDERQNGAPGSWSNFYRERGMVFNEGVVPFDPALSAVRCRWFNLLPEDDDRSSPWHPEVPRKLSSHNGKTYAGGPCTIQMTYDPDGDGRPNPFNLVSLIVRNGSLNVGTKSVTGEINVFNNLTPGEWGLTGPSATNLMRVTLEEINTSFGVDDIVFEPAHPAPAAPTGLSVASPTAGRLTLQWTDNSDNESGFEIEYRRSGSTTWNLVAKVGAGITTYTHSGRTAGITYVYRVRAYNAVGASVWSSAARGTAK